jgi:hypothetical protein
MRESGLAVRRGQAPEGTPGTADRIVLQRFERFMPQGMGMPTAREGNIAKVFRTPAVERHIVDFGPSMLRSSIQDINRVTRSWRTPSSISRCSDGR